MGRHHPSWKPHAVIPLVRICGSAMSDHGPYPDFITYFLMIEFDFSCLLCHAESAAKRLMEVCFPERLRPAFVSADDQWAGPSSESRPALPPCFAASTPQRVRLAFPASRLQSLLWRSTLRRNQAWDSQCLDWWDTRYTDSFLPRVHGPFLHPN